MTNLSRKDEILSALSVATLLLGTATGSAIAMIVISMIGLFVGFLVLRERMFRGVWLVAMVGFVVVAAIAIVTFLGHSH